MKELQMPSGATLKIYPAAFDDAWKLYQAVMEEAKSLPVSAQTDVTALLKDVICTSFYSKKIESCVLECMKKVTYDCGVGDLKIDSQTFQPVKNRADYPLVYAEVAIENILPFEKGLYAAFSRIVAMMPGSQK